MKSYKYQLFDLENDPDETKDLAGTGNQGIYLKGRMDEFLNHTYKAYTRKKTTIEYDEATIKKLKTLGYL